MSICILKFTQQIFLGVVLLKIKFLAGPFAPSTQSRITILREHVCIMPIKLVQTYPEDSRGRNFRAGVDDVGCQRVVSVHQRNYRGAESNISMLSRKIVVWGQHGFKLALADIFLAWTRKMDLGSHRGNVAGMIPETRMNHDTQVCTSLAIL